MSDKIKLTLNLSLDKLSTRAGRKELLNKLRAEFDKVAPIVLNEFEELDQKIAAAWDKAEIDRERDEAGVRSRLRGERDELRRERDELKSEVDKRRAKDAAEKADRERQAIETEIRCRQFLVSKFNVNIEQDIIEALLAAYVHGAEDWEFSRWDFVSQILSNKNVDGDQEKAEKVADRVASVVTMS
jgi:hypothetical protein